MRASVQDTENRREVIQPVNTNLYSAKSGIREKTGEPVSASVGVETIVIVEPRALNRECIARCLRSTAGYVVASYASLEEWLAATSPVPASVMVLGVLGELREPETRQQIAKAIEAAGRAPVIVLSDCEDPDQIMEVLNQGVRGYIPTTLPLDVAVESMRLVRAGGVFAPASCLMAARHSKEFARSGKLSGNGLFTARQAAVVEALRRGKANKIIAYELNMSESTVKVHVRNIMKKLKAKNRTEVAFLTNSLLKSEHI